MTKPPSRVLEKGASRLGFFAPRPRVETFAGDAGNLFFYFISSITVFHTRQSHTPHRFVSVLIFQVIEEIPPLSSSSSTPPVFFLIEESRSETE
jgi:hypothetical protein